MEKRDFEIVSVDGNRVVVKTNTGYREVVLDPAFKISMPDGKEIGLSELKPGMKGTAMVSTKTTSYPVVVTEVKNAEVLNVSGTTIIVRGEDGIKKYTAQDVRDKNVSIVREGERVDISQLRPGDRLTATIITKKAPTVTTEQAVKSAAVTGGMGSSSAPAKAAAAPAAAAPSSAMSSSGSSSSGSSASSESSTKTAKKLPKTGSHLPLAGGAGLLSLAAGLTLTALRRRR